MLTSTRFELAKQRLHEAFDGRFSIVKVRQALRLAGLDPRPDTVEMQLLKAAHTIELASLTKAARLDLALTTLEVFGLEPCDFDRPLVEGMTQQFHQNNAI